MSAPVTTTEATPAVAAVPVTKVFVGNLAFRTTDQDLQTLFKDCGGIKTGVIITRGRRSLGYGFIDFEKHEDAAKSVDVMNKKDFGGRPLKVELAQDHFERPDRFERTDRDGDEGDSAPRRNNRRRGNNADGLTVNPNPAPPASKALQPVKSTGPAQPRGQPRAPAQASADQGDDQGPAARRKRQRRRKSKAPQGEDGAPATQAANPPKAQRPKPAPREKVLSKTTLFVANLPFSVDDDQLAALFKDVGAKSAHVVRTHSGRSRGYGFVVFENEKDQLNALEKKNGASVEGTQTTEEAGTTTFTREIAISISSSVAPVEGEQPAAATPPQTK